MKILLFTQTLIIFCFQQKLRGGLSSDNVPYSEHRLFQAVSYHQTSRIVCDAGSLQSSSLVLVILLRLIHALTTNSATQDMCDGRQKSAYHRLSRN